MVEKKILQVSLEVLGEEELEALRNDELQEYGLTYYKKDIGEEYPVGYFICVDGNYKKGKIGELMQIAKEKDCYYIDIDDVF